MIYRDNTTIWAEKYRPRKVDDYICDIDFKNNIRSIIETRNVPHILLCGTSGIGKTTLAKMIINELDVKYLIINANDDMSVDSIRNKIMPFAQSVTDKDIKIVLLEEFHSVNIKQQGSLNYIFETYSDDTRFIITSNYPEKILPSIKSRCTLFDITETPKEDIMDKLLSILSSENIEYDLDDEDFINDVVNVINKYYPDMRGMINTINSRSVTGKYNVQLGGVKIRDEFNSILTILNSKKKSDQKIKEIRQIIIDMRVSNYDDIYKFIYSKVDDISGDLATNIMIIGQFQYQDYFSLDKEINLMSMFSSIITQE